ncbi:hypothetical protein QBC47DRAFT_181231 [Echria macrotheca]|uniref:Apple domain-containing protein n=1 Tax=Echria macrotheca TaxID=438768 RepID=A0AAJ0FCG4_9PEZI|nr:hypothetical protein QBC47DRAFT_181231 [Echria macrotheca]
MDQTPKHQHHQNDDPQQQGGIELSDRKMASPSPHYQEHSAQPGLQVLPTPDLEVLSPSGLEVRHVPSSDLHVLAPSSLEVVANKDYPYGGYQYPPGVAYHQEKHHDYHGANAIPSPYGGSPLLPGGGDEHKEPSPLAGGAGAGDGRRILGMKRNAFFITVALATFLVVVAIAVGVGVGIALGKHDGSSSSPSSTPRPFPLPTAQANTSSTKPIACPANNLTLYTSPVNASRHYTLLCGRDYNSGAGTLDLYNQPTDTMAECIDTCAGEPACVGAGWGSYLGKNVCWLKSYLATPQDSPIWYFAALDNVTGAGLPPAVRRRDMTFFV